MGKKVLWHIELPIGTGELAMAQKVIFEMAKSNDIDEIMVLSGSDTVNKRFEDIPEEIRKKIKIQKLPRITFESKSQPPGHYGHYDNGTKVHLDDLTERDELKNWHQHRTDEVMKHYSDFNPDMVVVSYWPEANGHIVDQECETLVRTAKSQGKQTVATTREIILADTPPAFGTFRRAAEILEKYIDKILVHGDPQLGKLPDTFSDKYIPKNYPKPDKRFRLKSSIFRSLISSKLQYTGYVADVAAEHKPDIVSEALREQIMVSCGLDWHDSASNLFWACMALAENPHLLPDKLQGKPWRFFVPSKCTDSERQALEAAAAAIKGLTVHVQGTVTDLKTHQAACDFSFQNGGISTFAEMVQGAKNFYPVPVNPENGASAEQTQRLANAEKKGFCTLGDRELVTTIGKQRKLIQEGKGEANPEYITALDKLAKHVELECSRTPTSGTIDCDGRRKSAEILTSMLSRSR